MSGRLFAYSLWCLAATGLFMMSGVFAYSPFADGGGMRGHYGFYGPTHK